MRLSRPDELKKIPVSSPFIAKKGDPGRPLIRCAIGPHTFVNAFCDLGASINVMSKATFNRIHGGTLTPANFVLQMADQSTRRPEGILEDVLVKIQTEYIPADFVILDMGPSEDTSLLLGRPFLYTAKADICMGKGFIVFHVESKAVKCPFIGYNRWCTQKKTAEKPVWCIEGSDSETPGAGASRQ